MSAQADERAARTIAIQQVLHRYCRSMDRMDAPLALSCFDPAAKLSYGQLYQGDPAGFVEWLWPVHAALVGHTHMLSNVLVGTDADSPEAAVSESYVTVTLRFVSDGEQFDVVGKGRYLDRWAQHGDDWWIVDRRYVSDLTSVVPVGTRDLTGVLTPTATDFAEPGASRDRADPSYRLTGLQPPAAGEPGSEPRGDSAGRSAEASRTIPEIPASHLDLLHAHRSVVLTTLNRDGTPQSTAVWSVLGDDGLVRVSFRTSGQKYRNLKRHPMATLFYVDPQDPNRTLEIRADVRLDLDDDERTGTTAVVTSYGVNPATMAASIASERAIATFVPRRVVALG